MADIRYQWNDGLNSVQVSGDVSLPQFKVLGHRQKTIEASLSTGDGEAHSEKLPVEPMRTILSRHSFPASTGLQHSLQNIWLAKSNCSACVLSVPCAS